MSLRCKALLATSLILLLLVSASALLLRALLTARFAELERREVSHAVDQAAAGLEQLLAAVDLPTHDWSAWDDSYAFMHTRAAAFRRSNLSAGALRRLRLNVMLFLDEQGRVVCQAAEATERGSGEAVALLPSPDALRRSGLLRPHPRQGRQGLLVLPAGLLLVSARSILRSDGSGPPRGVLVCGRYADRELQARLAATLGWRVRLWSAGCALPPEARQSLAGPTPEDDVAPLSEYLIAGRRVLSGLDGRPAAVLSVALPRELHRRGGMVVATAGRALSAVGVLLSLTVLLVLERLVLRRLGQLSERLAVLAETAEAGQYLPPQGKDELGRVVQGFNAVLGALAASQRRLLAADHLYRETINALPDWVHVVDEDLHVQVTNQGYRRFAAGPHSAAQAIGRPLSLAFPWLGAEATRVCQSSFLSPRVITREMTLPAPLSARVETRHVPIVEADRVRRVLTITRDLTPRYWEGLALRVAEEKFRRLFEEAPVGIFQATVEGRVLAANEALARVLGYATPQALLQALEETGSVLCAPPGTGATLLAEVLAQTTPLTRRQDFTTHEGRRVSAQLKLRAVRSAQGEPQLIEGFFDDVTEQRQAEEQLSRTLEDLARSNTELEQFAYVASHDLQEPLRMIASYLQLLARRHGAVLDDKGQTYLGFAVEGALRMQRLISDLLAYSRVGTRGEAFGCLDLQGIWEEVVANLEMPVRETGALLTHDPLPVVWGDPVQLVQLLQNLLGNALKFRREGVAPVIHLSVAECPEGWRLAVHDNGIGLDPGYAERIFVIFQRLHSREKYEGTGIGLAICKRIVERHGGQISVTSKPGGGATFTFTLARPEPLASGWEDAA